ncbi:hypothetical protein Pmar_PMAR011774 [Perkinsus marinus ATCC 50983]|uniref:Peptidase M50 domain-containing protein n=1 Tax=Perkinsus marinus (strain ATCC 50983 / TXsc) TaxID=423536 RepID=C5LCP3_PERM5|nr:hypothetical protein Pmar_PMAR011774 [Perkinsus marinus ATCC 50983]EER05726.1 hypothetical protein Pmar_PMAR011774 [Perkinsus marinus ATCC 50983]|eukprot:XP_002773910.1 hypothetical protein Pmar_PMAR011774 [Perkinsus marinus ATCC 50983]
MSAIPQRNLSIAGHCETERNGNDFSLTVFQGNRLLPRLRVHPTILFYSMGQLIVYSPGFGSVSVCILVVTVFLHEMGHAAAARLVGGHTDEVTLWPLGGLGVSWYDRTFRNKLFVTLAGPLVNVFLFGGWFLAGGATFKKWEFDEDDPDTEITLSDWEGLCFWAAALNLWLVAVNLLVPVYPLDASCWTGQLFYRCLCRSAKNASLVMIWLALVCGLFFLLLALVTFDPLMMVITGWCFYQMCLLIKAFCDGSISDHPLFNFDETALIGRRVVIQTQLNMPPLGVPVGGGSSKMNSTQRDLSTFNGDFTPTNRIVTHGRSPIPGSQRI